MRLLHIHDRMGARGGADHYVWDLIEHIPVKHGLAVGKDDGPPRTGDVPFWVIDGLDSNRPAPVNIRETIEEWGPDIVHVHNIMNPNLLNQLGDIPTVVTLHDHRAFCPGQGKWTLQGAPCLQVMSRDHCQPCFTDMDYFESIYQLTEQRQSGLRPFHISAVSSYMAQELSAVGLRPSTIIAPAIAHQPAEEGPAGNSVVFAGRLVRAKGVWNAAEAWRESGVEFPLVFVGTGRERGGLERAGFEVTGWLSREQTLRIISRAKAVIFPPNWQEPYGMVGPEALQFNVPVVAWKSGGIQEWCPHDYLVEYGDIKGLGRALQRAVSQTTGSIPSAKCSHQLFAKQWLQAYQQILSDSSD